MLDEAAEIGAIATLTPGGTPTILLYDAVPGGAMLSTQMMDDALLRRVPARAVERTDGGCGCGPEGSCSSCLRWYENRWAHPYLKREAVNAWLKTVEREFSRRR